MNEGLIVLSLFDGMSCGRIALERAEIGVNRYYSSEIDEHAISISNENWPQDTENRLGDITKWREWNIEWGKIDLLIGGSPCQGFSFAGKQLNFNDPRSSLFFEFLNIFNHIKKYNPDVKIMLENVKMKKEFMNIISDLLRVEPIEINSALVSAQNRRRLYWTNIKGVTQPKDRKIYLEDIFEKNFDEKLVIPKKYKAELKKDTEKNVDKSYRLGGYMKQGQGQRIYSLKGKSVCLSALGGGWGAKTGLYYQSGIIRKPTQCELEKLQTVPSGYTKNVDYNKAAKMLGNGWTVDVIAHIFKGLKKEIGN